jgi:hypothetical protein
MAPLPRRHFLVGRFPKEKMLEHLYQQIDDVE